MSTKADFTIWVDNDACPKRIRDIIFKASEKRRIPVKLVANQGMRLPPLQFVEMICVSQGFDKADDHIVESIAKTDLVITNDIPLADRIVSKGGYAINPKGKLFDKHSIKEHLAMRNLSEELRSAGGHTGGPRSLSEVDVREFAASFDRMLTKLSRLSKT